MRIVITGANGQLGRDCQKILSTKHTVIACNHQTLDIGNRSAVGSLLANQQPQIIINCAAYTAVDRCEEESETAWRVNATGPENLAKEAAKIDARLLHISTDYVFDGNKQIPQRYLEEDTTNPLSEYGRSKLAGEQAVLKYHHNSVILRTAWLYSEHGGNFLKTMLKLTTADPQRELKVVNDQYGSLTWSYSLAKQLSAVIDHEITGIVHATSEGYSTWYQVACSFLTKMHRSYTIRPCTTTEYPTPAPRPANSILENQVLKKAGCNLFCDWQTDLDEFVRKHGETLLKELDQENCG